MPSLGHFLLTNRIWVDVVIGVLRSVKAAVLIHHPHWRIYSAFVSDDIVYRDFNYEDALRRNPRGRLTRPEDVAGSKLTEQHARLSR